MATMFLLFSSHSTLSANSCRLLSSWLFIHSQVSNCVASPAVPNLTIVAIAMLFLLLAPLLDLGFNAATALLHFDKDMLLMLVLLQDTLQVLALLGLAVRFSSTFAFQAGLIGHLLRRFSATILCSLLYLGLSILLHFVSLRDRWNSSASNSSSSTAVDSSAVRGPGAVDEQQEGHNLMFVWTTETTVLFTLQRTVSALHYFLFKRTILVLNDPKYHRESEWLMRKIGS